MDKQTPPTPMEEQQAIPSKLSKSKKTLLMIAGVVALASVALVFLFGTQIICFHNWEQADCISPRTCTHCGTTDGEPSYEKHAWENATCISPATCSKCAETKGDTIGHKYVDGSCETCGVSEPNAAKDSTSASSYSSSSSPSSSSSGSSSSGAVSTVHYAGSSSSGTASPGQHSHAPTPEEGPEFVAKGEYPGSGSSSSGTPPSGMSSGTPPSESPSDSSSNSYSGGGDSPE